MTDSRGGACRGITGFNGLVKMLGVSQTVRSRMLWSDPFMSMKSLSRDVYVWYMASATSWLFDVPNGLVVPPEPPREGLDSVFSLFTDVAELPEGP